MKYDNLSFIAVQNMTPVADEHEANEIFAAEQCQEGYIGGRILAAGGGKPMRVQTFYRDEVGDGRNWQPLGSATNILPDGMQRVLILWDKRAELGIDDLCLFHGALQYRGNADGHGGYAWRQFLNGQPTGHSGHCDSEDRKEELKYFSWMFATGRIGMGGYSEH